MRLTLFLILSLAPLAAPAAEIVYYFVDEQGVQHFSNVPNDRRYEPLCSTMPVAGVPARAVVEARPAPVRPPVVQSDSIVELEEGEAIEVEIENDDHGG